MVLLGGSCRQNLARWSTLCPHTRCLQIVWRPLASWIASSTVWRIRRLQLPRERQCRTEPLFLDDRTGRHRLDLVEHPERERFPEPPQSVTFFILFAGAPPDAGSL